MWLEADASLRRLRLSLVQKCPAGWRDIEDEELGIRRCQVRSLLSPEHIRFHEVLDVMRNDISTVAFHGNADRLPGTSIWIALNRDEDFLEQLRVHTHTAQV